MALVVNYIVDVYMYESERFCVLKNMNDLYLCPHMCEMGRGREGKSSDSNSNT